MVEIETYIKKIKEINKVKLFCKEMMIRIEQFLNISFNFWLLLNILFYYFNEALIILIRKVGKLIS